MLVSEIVAYIQKRRSGSENGFGTPFWGDLRGEAI